MERTFGCATHQGLCVAAFALLLAAEGLHAQYLVPAIDDPHSQADYVIISPSSYTTIMQSLVDHRASRSHLRVALVTTEAIYQIFGQGTRPDSAIRAFVTFTLTSWADPKPGYFLLAGNVNMIPSHREQGILEDSIWVDQWFVEGVEDTGIHHAPGAALGRLPGWNEAQMATLVAKTIAYDLSDGAGWRNRALTAADYRADVGFLFEDSAQRLQVLLAPRWTDTITAHVRISSPLHKSRSQFRAIWNSGAAIVTFIGFLNRTTFSNDRYFTTEDIDSLADGTPLPFVRFMGGQPFDPHDTLTLVEKLMVTPDKGAVCTLSPVGPAYFDISRWFTELLVQAISANPTPSIGSAICDIKGQSLGLDQWRQETLLGDPALVIKNPLLAGDGGPGSGGIPGTFALYQNYPNPFNPSTQINFELPSEGMASLKLFNILGQEVGTLLHGLMEAGTHTYTLNADRLGLGSGIYFYRLTSGNRVQTRKMVLVR